MPRLSPARAAVSLLCAAFLAGGCAPAPSPPPRTIPTSAPAPLSVVEVRIHELVNLRRARLGLAPLVHDERVAAAAREHSARMADARRLSHDGFDARVTAIRGVLPVGAAAENVAYDSRDPSADRLVSGWIASPGHRRNIEGDYQVTGVGGARGAGGVYYATQIFLASP